MIAQRIYYPFKKAIVNLVSCTLALILLIPPFSFAPVPSASLYIEPSLLQSSGDQSVIVSAQSSGFARRAVRAVGGQISDDLWLIESVVTTLSASQLQRLAQQPGLRSVIANKDISPADAPVDGWVTDRHVYAGTYQVSSNVVAPPVALPNGNIFTIADSGLALILNGSGKEISRRTLAGGNFLTAPVLDNEGTIFVAGEAKQVHAISSDGTLRWSFTSGGKFNNGVVVDNARDTVYATDENGNVYALVKSTGALRWQKSIHTLLNLGQVVATPALGSNGTLYVLTLAGTLVAVTPTGQTRNLGTLLLGLPFKFSPLVGADGTIYVAGETQWVYALHATGALKYQFSTLSKLTAPPVLGADGTLYVVEELGRLHALNTDGSVRFSFTPALSTFYTSPVLSPDGSQVYVAAKQQKLYAVSTISGQASWSYTTSGDLSLSPDVDMNGQVHLTDLQANYAVLSQAGVELSKFDLRTSPKHRPVFLKNPRQTTLIADTSNTFNLFSRLPDLWDGSPDVIATSNKHKWKLVNPSVIDVGADQLHQPTDSSRKPITGEGITVAVLDTGVYFNEEVRGILGNQVSRLFVGQADFVNTQCDLGGVQFADHCFQDASNSKDGHGHGTHVAGTIWSHFIDATSGVMMGIAPQAQILSVRTLDHRGMGSYADTIKGIQYVVKNKEQFRIRVLNLSISALAVVPYFVDPMNRAVERAWASGISVVVAAGNEGSKSETITVPGNDPYVITVGALDSARTPGFWEGDTLPQWSSTGPTMDGFVKPDVLAPGAQIVSFMHSSATLAKQHPDYVATPSLFRMNGTSMATAVTSGVVALMLEANPTLTPDQVKFRLAYSARPALTGEEYPVYNLLQQGMGRIWAPTAVFGEFPAEDRANQGMDIRADLAHGWEDDIELSYHYQGGIQRVRSDDGSIYLYYAEAADGTRFGLGAVRTSDMSWIDLAEVGRKRCNLGEWSLFG